MTSTLLERFVSRFSYGFVLAFHEISPQRIVDLIDCLKPARPIPLPELVQRSKDGKVTSGLFAITVDDGVGENVRALSRTFLAQQWPATFYLPTHYLDTGERMMYQWWQTLKPLVPRRRLNLKSGCVDLSSPGAVEEFSKKLELMWHTQRMETYYATTMELLEIVRATGVDPGAIEPPAPISWNEVTELCKSDLLGFESHGVSHAAMSSLTEQELSFELRHSRDVIESHTGRPCRHLAYPFGSTQSIGSKAVALSKNYYDSAATMSLGHVDHADPWFLPRIPLYPENSALLAWMKILLKCSAVGPKRTDRVAA